MGYARIDRSAQAVPEESWNDVQLQAYSSHPAPLYSPPEGPPPVAMREGSPETQHSRKSMVRHWPVESQKIWVMTPFRGFVMFLDVILASAPIMFLALAFIAARLDGKQVSEYGQHLHQGLLLSPTLFPVIFAALMGRCFRSVGLYLAERGTTLGRLEQLIGCNSLFSALERQIALRSWSVVGLSLTVLWLLSPLGGQSALRLLGTEDASVESTATVQYMNPTAFQDSNMMGASAMNSGRSSFTSIFLAALLSSTRYGRTPADLWGNVKIPQYSSIENTTSSDWKMVPNANSSDVSYASLIGIPVANIDEAGQSNFSIKARQWDITCDSNKNLDGDKADFGNKSQSGPWKLTLPKRPCSQYPCNFSFKSAAGYDSKRDVDDIDDIYNYSVASCEVSFYYVEAAINCNSTSCAANSLRKLDLFSDNYDNGTDSFTRNNLIFNSMLSLTTVDTFGVADAAVRGSTYPERWMMDPNNFMGMGLNDNVKLYLLSPELLATRLTIIFNTFWQSTYASIALGGNLPHNLTSLSDNDTSLTFNSTSATISTPSPPIYKTNWTWFTLLLVSSIVLQVAAYVGLILKYYTCVPDIIGYASSMTLTNPYVPTPTGGTTLHGLERAALLQDLPVRIGDVCADEPIGAIAFAKADEGRVGRLDRSRFYI